MTPTDAAYLAGLFDGEGSLGIRAHNKPGNKAGADRRTPHYRLVATIANRDIAVLLWVQQRIGGTVYPKSCRKPTWAIAYEWGCSNREQLAAFLVAIHPFVQIKRRQVEIADAFLALGSSRVTFSARGKTWPRRIQHPDDVDQKQALKDAMNAANVRGAAYASGK